MPTKDRGNPVKITAVPQGARGPTILHTFVYSSTVVLFFNYTLTTSHQASQFATVSRSFRLSTKIFSLTVILGETETYSVISPTRVRTHPERPCLYSELTEVFRGFNTGRNCDITKARHVEFDIQRTVHRDLFL